MVLLEILLFLLLLGFAARLVARRPGRMAWGPAASLGACGLAALLLWRPGTETLPARAAPAAARDAGWAGSGACQSCHPSQHATWSRTFHRTMTQVAGPLAIAAPLSRTTLRTGPWTTVLEPAGGTFMVDMVDPVWAQRMAAGGEDPASIEDPPRFVGPVVMTTGSHHLQVYWVRRANGAFVQVPWVWFLAENRWIPVTASLLQPPSGGLGAVTEWNSNCVACHSVGGEPRIDLERQVAATRAGELGIACEACHGPAAAHVRANRSPWRRYALHRSGAADATTVLPPRLDHRRASEACGQCHSVWVEKDFASYLATGKPYRAGGDLEEALHVVRYEEEPRDEWLRRWLSQSPDKYSEYFWKDGTVRVTGREYNGLLESPCFQRGELSCLTCHSMHEAEPADQLRPEAKGDAVCFQCHGALRGRIEEHTRHKTGSTGSACQSCHMPYTTYGLFTAIRSHRIDNPSAAVSLRTGRPNACNQCHVDRTLAWTAEYLTAWYGQPPVALPAEQREVPATLLWLLSGDAAQRTLAAWTLGWDAARGASGDGWQAPFLAGLLEDPYAATRYVAYRALRELPGYSDFDYDFVESHTRQRPAVERALARWRLGRWPEAPAARAFFDAQGRLRRDRVAALAARRDDRPVILSE